MWKILFEFSDRLFLIVPVKKWRDWLRVWVLFDYRNKLNALKTARPDLNFKHMRLRKGGGSIVFIIDNKLTFKVRKRNKETINFERFNREKRITDALRPFCNIQIPHIEFIHTPKYTFYQDDFISGKLLVDIPTRRIKKYQGKISHQLAMFIYEKSFANPAEISDLRPKKTQKDYVWNHGDMCSNILIDPKTMTITGIIDWEWAAYSDISNEFRGLVRVRKKMRKIGLDKTTLSAYEKIVQKNK